MATQDINANIHIKDESGNINNIYPATKIANVEGLQSALNAKANASDVTSGLAGKVDKVTGKGLSTNDYTTAEKNKLAGIESQANKTVVDSALSASSTNPVQNKVINTALGTKADSSTVTALTSRVATNETDIATQTARIDAIAALPSGSTSGDAELMDIRTKADGTTATNAGTAVREQVTALKNNIDIVRGGLKCSVVETTGSISADGKISTHTVPLYFYEVTPNTSITINTTSSTFYYAFYTSQPTYGMQSYNGERSTATSTSVSNVDVPSNCTWVAIRGNDATITPIMPFMDAFSTLKDAVTGTAKTLSISGSTTIMSTFLKNIKYKAQIELSTGRIEAYARSTYNGADEILLFAGTDGAEIDFSVNKDFNYIRVYAYNSATGTIEITPVSTPSALYDNVMIDSNDNRLFRDEFDLEITDSGNYELVLEPNLVYSISFDVTNRVEIYSKDSSTGDYKIRIASSLIGECIYDTNDGSKFIRVQCYNSATGTVHFKRINSISELYNNADDCKLANPLLETFDSFNSKSANKIIKYEAFNDSNRSGVQWRTPSCIVTNTGAFLTIAADRSGYNDDDEAKLCLIRIFNGAISAVQTLFAATGYVYGNPSFVIDSNANGRIYAFAYKYATGTPAVEQGSSTTDCVYKYSDTDGVSWSNEISIKNKWDTTKYKNAGSSPANGYQDGYGNIFIPAIYAGLDNKWRSGIIYKPVNGDWTFSEPTDNVGDNESTVYQDMLGRVILNCRTYDPNLRREYIFDTLNYEFHQVRCNFNPAVNCEMAITKATISGMSILLMSFSDASNASTENDRLRDRPTLWASLDGHKWIRVYRASASGLGYTSVSENNGNIIFAYEINNNIFVQDVTNAATLIVQSVKTQLNRSLEYRLQEIIDRLL